MPEIVDILNQRNDLTMHITKSLLHTIPTIHVSQMCATNLISIDGSRKWVLFRFFSTHFNSLIIHYCFDIIAFVFISRGCRRNTLIVLWCTMRILFRDKLHGKPLSNRPSDRHQIDDMNICSLYLLLTFMNYYYFGAQMLLGLNMDWIRGIRRQCTPRSEHNNKIHAKHVIRK